MKFMFAPSAREMFLPTLLIYNTEKGVDNSLMRHKILTFTGTEEKVQKIADETNYTTRFVFEDEGEKYYYDIKNMRLDEICERMPRACINGLVYLQDVDTAKDLLIGKTIYIQSVWMMPTAIPAIGIYLFPSIRKQLSRPSEWAARRIP